jgi:hypothetical protein
LTPRARPARRRSGPGRRLLGYAIGAVVVAVVFVLGIGLGGALEDEPDPRTRTLVRTLKPLELPPARETVTVRVTVTAP